MPRRWLSIRGRNKDQSMTFNPTETHSKKEFDFAFPSEPIVFHEDWPVDNKSTPTTRLNCGKEDNMERNYHPTVAANSQLQVVGDMTISCSTPPTTNRDRTQHNQVSHGLQAVHQHNCKPNNLQPHHIRGSSRSASLATRRRWRKLSEVFRPGIDIDEDTSACHLRPIIVEEKKLGLPISRIPWRNPTSPPVVQADFVPDNTVHQTIDSIVHDKPSNQLPKPYVTESYPVPNTDDFHPHLEVQIPLTPLERFSVMFRGIHGERQSDLLFPDKSTIVQSHLQTGGKKKATTLATPLSKRPATSPTVPRFENSPAYTGSQGYRSSKYSLFPTTPKSLRHCSNTSSPTQTRRRSVTAPAEVQHLSVETFSISSGIMPQSQDNMQFTSNIPKVQEPIASRPEPQHRGNFSRVLSDNEIFFDIKSFRDSKGVEGGHFEMTRPPSAAVQMARSRSNARKVVRGNTALEPITGSQGKQEKLKFGFSKDTSAQIDETIAIVESLTSSSTIQTSSSKASQHSDSQNQCEAIQLIKQSSPEISLADVHEIEEISTFESQGALTMSVRSENAIELSDLTQVAAFDNGRHHALIAEPPIDSISPVETTNESDTNLVPSSGTANTTVIPLSKYAPKDITEGLIGLNAIGPVRPRRSNTENAIGCRLTKNERPLPHNSKRASSSPANLATLNHRSEASVVADGSQLNHENKSMPMMIAYVKPAAEVSIARKVSVTRKQSAKIVEPRSSAKAQISTLPRGLEVSTEIQQSNVTDRKRQFQVDKKLPVVQEVHPKHKPGVSVSAILDSATIGSSDSLPASVDLKLRSRLEKALPPIPVS